MRDPPAVQPVRVGGEVSVVPSHRVGGPHARALGKNPLAPLVSTFHLVKTKQPPSSVIDPVASYDTGK